MEIIFCRAICQRERLSQCLVCAVNSGRIVQIRDAERSEGRTIKRMVRRNRLNPQKLHWYRFSVACNADGRIIGIGQLKHHRGGIVELASIAVERGYRKRGIASLIIRYLIRRESGDLWLTCRSTMVDFYIRYGFHEIRAREDFPREYRAIGRISSVLRMFGRDHVSLMVLNKSEQR